MKYLVVMLFLVSLIPLSAGNATAQVARNKLVFTIDNGVSAEDVAYVQEGIRFAQEYLINRFGVIPDDSTSVYIRNSGAVTNIGEIGESSGNYVAIFTRASGWISASAMVRIGITIHEFIHIYTTDQIEYNGDTVPAWMIEGTAEVLSTDSLIAAGLLTRADADGYRYWSLEDADTIGDLKTYESSHAYQSADPRVYDLSYLGMRWLTDHGDADEVMDFYEQMRDGAPWSEAFTSSFAIDPDTFYQQFETARDTFLLPIDEPLPYVEVTPEEVDAPARFLVVPDEAVRGDQLIFTAQSVAGSRCIFYLSGSSIDLSHETTVDATGAVFWIVSIAGTTMTQHAELSLDCGGGEIERIVVLQ